MADTKQEATEQTAGQNDDKIQPAGSKSVPQQSSASESQKSASKRELNKLKKDQLVDLAFSLNKTVSDIRNASASVIDKTSKATPSDPLSGELIKKMNNIAKILANELIYDHDFEDEIPKDIHGQYDSIRAYRRPENKFDSCQPIFGEKDRNENLMIGINSNKAYKGGRSFKKHTSSNFSLRKRKNNKDGPKSGIKCFKCNKMGHKAKNCRVKQDNNVFKKDTYENNSQKYKGKTVPVCKASSDSILSIVKFVNGTRVKLDPDSGIVEFIISNKI
ncbi:unnamed protein product [Brachionus calyciflorus]|uniref:CCHC-type domain-containing protein n=1 Tax=Brachionus calyciflorus TaxID=104777 RepID=A0A813P0C6_9BILA|nr:unnamed protein product [Brachionus calyciflorus]